MPQITRQDAYLNLLREMNPNALSKRQDAAHGVVYFMELDGLIKIGKTLDLRRRLSSLSHPGITVLATEPGYTELEAALHRRFKEHQVRGEWFRAHPDLLRYIDGVRTSA